MPDLNKFVQHAIDICNDDRRGYDQPRRMSGVDIDCSELVRESLAYGGFSVPNWMWTGNMFAELPKRGWTWHQGVAGIKRGDILWKTGHTAVYIGGNRLAEASANEKGGASGGKPGDQTGREVRVRGNALDYPAWAGYFTYTGTGNTEEDDVVTEQDMNRIAEKVWQYNWNNTANDGNQYNCVNTMASNVKDIKAAFVKQDNGFSGVGDLVASHPYGTGSPESEKALWDRIAELNARQQEINMKLDKLIEKMGA